MTTFALARIGAPEAPAATAPECDLPARALRGDVAAWNALISRHNHRVVVALLARGVPVSRARDVAQDAWLKLIEQQRAGKLAELRLPSLAITQAIFLSIDAARRDLRERAVMSSSPADAADPRDLADERMLSDERLRVAERVLSRCTPNARRVFELAYAGDGLSHAEIAAQVGLSTQRVRQIVCEVRKLLRDALAGAFA